LTLKLIKGPFLRREKGLKILRVKDVRTIVRQPLRGRTKKGGKEKF